MMGWMRATPLWPQKNILKMVFQSEFTAERNHFALE